ncbi:MAG TPA: response regulator [Myxococcaceae bacterium]|nr:response regulator [Myxococcaceae bacterium]
MVKPLALHILVVDDDLSAALRCTYSLLDAGFEVDIATTSGDALRLLSERRYIAAVVDLVMPDLAGRQVSLAVRALSPDAALVVVGEDPESVARPLAPDHYLHRPFAPDDLLEALSLALTEARVRQLVANDDGRSSIAVAR